MTFNSIQYLLFLAAVIGLVWTIPRGWRNPFLLIASYVFYASWDWRFMALILTSTAIGYTSGLALHRSDDEAKRKRILVIRIALNLLLLGVFKYFNFFIETGVNIADSVGLGLATPAVQILLPIAISYMTFEEIAYAMDIYRRKIEPTRSVVDYGLFVAFFPKLVAGPILRPLELLPQISGFRARPDTAQIREGLGLILLGLFKKVVIADSMARVADAAFNSPDANGTVALVVGIYAFAFQIYGDFSGYTDIARGSAILLGFHLPLNFKQPYLSNSITAFWRTWHISLSTWLRDYLYVPLGGNRSGPRRTMINLFLVMLLGGLWHGAAWTFVAWGALHGVYLAVERATGIDRKYNNADRPARWADLPRIILTFNLVCVAWLLFRSPDFGTASTYVAAMIDIRAPFEGGAMAVLLLPVAAIVVLLDVWQRRTGREVPWDATPIPRGAFVGAASASIVLFSGAAPVPFIYFQF